MSSPILINGIQQVGIGCADAPAVFTWYRQYLGFDIRVFDDEAAAELMTQYTGEEVFHRRAILAMNMNGGGGLEIWQFTDRTPSAPSHTPQLGDLGINVMKLRSRNLKQTLSALDQTTLPYCSDVYKDPLGRAAVFLKDPWGNAVEIIEESYTFSKQKSTTGAVMGVSIGVSDMDKSVSFYRDVLGYDIPQYDSRSKVWGGAKEGEALRCVSLKRKDKRSGGFTRLLGPTEIELVQSLDRPAKKTFAGRYWGDLGYIHVCFDVSGMQSLTEQARSQGYPFTVDSGSGFDMGEAAGRFGYIEDPDGTLIELVETLKVPILKSLGLYIDMRKRDPQKPLPNYLVKAMAVHRVRD